MSFERMFELLSPIMKALSKVHSQGLIHRDISPTNIMLMDNSPAILIDFGTVRDFSENGNLTYSVMLKVGYSPEEQYRRNGKQGPWTDVYALSATAYYLLTGKVPLDSVSRLFDDSVTPISTLNPEVTEKQNAVIFKGMAVNKDDRYQNMDEMYEAFAACADEKTSAASSPVANAMTAAPSVEVTYREPSSSVNNAPEMTVTDTSGQSEPAKTSTQKIPEPPKPQKTKTKKMPVPEESANAADETPNKKPNKFGLIGSVILGLMTLFGFMITVQAISSANNEEATILDVLIWTFITAGLGAGTFFSGKTYYPRTKKLDRKPNFVFLGLSILSLIMSIGLVIYFSFNYDYESMSAFISLAACLAVVAVYFSWLFFRRLKSVGKKRFKMGCVASAVFLTVGVIGTMSFNALTTVMIGDQQIKTSEETVHVYGDQLTNRDIKRLKMLHNLKSLTISTCLLDDEDVKLLSEITWLEELKINNNSDITDISPLSAIKSLQVLDVSGTSVENVDVVSALPNLQSLNLSNTKVKDISSFSSCEALEDLIIVYE